MSEEVERIRDQLAAAVERINARSDEAPDAVLEMKRTVDSLRARLREAEMEARAD